MEFVSKTLCRKCIWNFNTTAKYLGTAFFLHNHCQTIFYNFQSLFSLALLVWFSMPLLSHFSLASGISVTLEDPLHLCLPHHPHQFCVSGSRAQHWDRTQLPDQGCLCAVTALPSFCTRWWAQNTSWATWAWYLTLLKYIEQETVIKTTD